MRPTGREFRVICSSATRSMCLRMLCFLLRFLPACRPAAQHQQLCRFKGVSSGFHTLMAAAYSFTPYSTVLVLVRVSGDAGASTKDYSGLQAGLQPTVLQPRLPSPAPALLPGLILYSYSTSTVSGVRPYPCLTPDSIRQHGRVIINSSSSRAYSTSTVRYCSLILGF